MEIRDGASELVVVEPEDEEVGEGSKGGRDFASEVVVAQINLLQHIHARKKIVGDVPGEMVVGQVDGLEVVEELEVGDGTDKGIVHQADGAEMGHGGEGLDVDLAHEGHVLEAEAPDDAVEAEDAEPVGDVAGAGGLRVDGGIPAGEGDGIVEGGAELAEGVDVGGFGGGEGREGGEEEEEEEEE